MAGLTNVGLRAVLVGVLTYAMLSSTGKVLNDLHIRIWGSLEYGAPAFALAFPFMMFSVSATAASLISSFSKYHTACLCGFVVGLLVHFAVSQGVPFAPVGFYKEYSASILPDWQPFVSIAFAVLWAVLGFFVGLGCLRGRRLTRPQIIIKSLLVLVLCTFATGSLSCIVAYNERREIEYWVNRVHKLTGSGNPLTLSRYSEKPVPYSLSGPNLGFEFERDKYPPVDIKATSETIKRDRSRCFGCTQPKP